MTDNPTTNTGTYDLLGERRQEGISFSASTTGTGEGLKVSQRSRAAFGQAAQQTPQAKPQTAVPGTNPASYDQQGFLAKFLINILLMLTGNLDADNKGNNSLISLISKAFGMNDDDNHTEFRQLQSDVKTRGRETVRRERDYSRFDADAAASAVKMGEPILGKNIYNSQMLELIGKGESGGDYNRVYGKAKRIDLTNMTINEVIAWQKQYTENGSPSSAAGKYQVIRKTLEASVREMGLTGNEKFDPAMQDRVAMHLLNKRGYNALMEGRMKEGDFANSVAKEWASLKGTNGRGAYDGDGLNAGKISAGQAIAASRQDRTVMSASFDDARTGAPKPPATNNPIVVADATPTVADTTPPRRQPSAPAGAIPT